ncbi:hypothetical protein CHINAEXTREME_20520 (plasmid) [Halobiforma lacisalsi AJ5]|uniref:Uncharacterized protein n=1 Tax=Natronobacterium lacisalsi AJ5 TaxID=358396 RepID=M0LZ35_NATLA|nr:hypothetical protein [Halobiforma lacisalsi]APX00199.1 hypothetical protein CHINAEXTREME_20520 [Halobiforma lacisalsi AJ5]EMA37385.1 hypothetical protein C445_00811 [Halobiforma lacisalsi AJ5]
MGLISRLLDSVDNAVDSSGEAAASVTETKFDTILKGVAIAVAAILLLIFFALNARLTIILIAVLVAGAYLLGLGDRGRNADGPRR